MAEDDPSARIIAKREPVGAILEAIPYGLILVDPDGFVVWNNPAAESAFLAKPGGLLSRRLGLPTPRRTQIQHIDRTPAGHETELLSDSVIWNGKDTSLIAVRAVADQAAIAQRSLYDPLTDLPNRVLLKDRVEQAVSSLRRTRGVVAVTFVDLDGFKGVNDAMGHRVGDAILRQAAFRLRAASRPSDTIARFGGDEFVFVHSLTGEMSELETVLERLLAVVAEPYDIGGQHIHCTASAGIRLVWDPNTETEEIISDADLAMYAAKDSNRGGYRIFRNEMRVTTSQRFHVRQNLHSALNEGRLQVHYQPITDSEGRVQHVEALARLQDPDLGMVPAELFISTAEETGLIVELGAEVLRKACEQLANWTRHAGADSLGMSVNLSALQMTQKNLPQLVESCLIEFGIPPSRLSLEITETAFVDHQSRVIENMEAIRQLGVGLLIDDFGTGYSSLTYLRDLPVSGLKIDRTFVTDIVTNVFDEALVTSQIMLAHQLGLRTIAEGVETIEAHRKLLGLGCDLFQGYLYSRPVPADELTKLISEDPHPGMLAAE